MLNANNFTVIISLERAKMRAGTLFEEIVLRKFLYLDVSSSNSLVFRLSY